MEAAVDPKLNEKQSFTDIAMQNNTERVFQDGEALQLVELQQKLKAQIKYSTRLEEENLRLQKALDEFTKGNKMKKRRLEEDTQQDDTNHLKEQIKNLEIRLSEREEELHELRKKIAESEWPEDSESTKNERKKKMIRKILHF